MKISAVSSVKNITVLIIAFLSIYYVMELIIFTSQAYENKNTAKEKSRIDKTFLLAMKEFRKELYPELLLNVTLIEEMSLLTKDQNIPKTVGNDILPFCKDIDFTFDSSSFHPPPLKIDETLAKGTNRVYKVHQSQTHKEFILKIYGSKKDFKKEVELYNAMHMAGNHENVVKPYCILKAENSPIILENKKREGVIMQFVSSKDVSSNGWSQRDENTIEDIRKMSIKVFKAMKWIHSLGWVHSDLHGCNVIIDKSNNPVIIDFGNSNKIKNHIQQKWDSWIGVKAPESSYLVKSTKYSINEAMDVWTYANTVAGWFANKYISGYKGESYADSTYSYRQTFSLVFIHPIYGFNINRTPKEFPSSLRQFLYILINPDPLLRSIDNKDIRTFIEGLDYFIKSF